jgi:hypothetical protein
MNLRVLAEQDLATTLEDAEFGFGWPVTFTNPVNQDQQTLNGQVHKVSLDYDPQTGAIVKTEKQAITIRQSSLTIGEPKQNWKVSTTDINNNPVNGTIITIMPDDALGITTYLLSV